MTGRRLLLVHAHPDDESIGNGATMARYAAEGAEVTLVTCTRGEQGEVIPPELAYLAPERGAGLGPFRERELATALAALGVSDQVFLGAPDRVFRDSGMAYADDGRVVPAPRSPSDAFALADVDDAAALLAAVVRRARPHVLVAYEPGGGYGHPDHVQAHRVAMRSLDLAAAPDGDDPGWAVPKVYWTVVPRSLVPEPPTRPGHPPGPMPSMVVDDALVTTRIDAGRHRDAKVAALRAHATQIAVAEDGSTFGLSNGVVRPIVAVEHYRLVHGRLGDPDPDGFEPDLFAGLEDGPRG